MTAANHPLSRRPWRGGSHGARMGACGRGDPFLLHLLPEDMRPPDSFVAETRRHLKGCIDHAATVILRELSLDPQLAQAADAIQSAVVDQRDATTAIGESARDTARDATRMTRQMEDVADVARDTENLSSRVSGAVSGLVRTAQELQRATDLFVGQLEAA